MERQPKPGYNSDDCVQTHPALCQKIVEHLNPTGKILEPFAGDGNFLRAIAEHCGYAKSNNGDEDCCTDWCEIQKGRDFYKYDKHADWIITNPPFGQLRDPRKKDSHPISALVKCFQTADNVALLLTLNHAIGLKRRYKMADEAGFSVKEIILLDTPPKPWPQSGFQVACVHWSNDVVHSHKTTKSYTVTDWRGRYEDFYEEQEKLK